MILVFIFRTLYIPFADNSLIPFATIIKSSTRNIMKPFSLLSDTKFSTFCLVWNPFYLTKKLLRCLFVISSSVIPYIILKPLICISILTGDFQLLIFFGHIIWGSQTHLHETSNKIYA